MMSDLILAGVAFVLAAANASRVIKFKLMQINKKSLTFVISSCAIVIFVLFLSSETLGISNSKGFNADPKNYNAKLQIFDQNSTRLASFDIAIAKSDKQKEQGLMNLKTLPKNQGMLFPFQNIQVVMMWMKNTSIPLDMIFIDDDKEIATIKTNTTPNSLELISSERKVKYVLEINAGLAKEYGLEIGQTVQILN